MTLNGKGRLILQGYPSAPSRAFVYLPIELARDSQFPFKTGNCPVRIEVDPVSRVIRVFPLDR